MFRIKYIWIDDISADYKNGEIEEFYVNGEMAQIKWYRQGNREYNGKYVTMIEYFDKQKGIDER